MREFCLGQIGMSSKEFDCITYFDLELKIKGYNKKIDHKDFMLREIAFSSYIGSHIDPKSLKGINRQKFLPLRFDKKTTPKITEERKNRLADLIKKVKNGKAGD